MKKLISIIVAFAALSTGLFAQDRELNQIQLSKEGSRIETDLFVAFPMHFGASALVNPTYKGLWNTEESLNPHFLDTQLAGNFVYALEMVSLSFRSDASPLEASIGLGWTFMDFTFKNSRYTFEKVGDYAMPVPIVMSGYDGRKSKYHATYFDVPLRISYKAGRGRIYAGASAGILVKGYTKYKHPRVRTTLNDIFNPFRATVEAGFGYGVLGFFVNYGLTPLFPETLSDARTLTFGLTLGM